MQKRDQFLSINITDKTRKAIEQAAKDKRRSLSGLTSIILEENINKYLDDPDKFEREYKRPKNG